MSPTEARQELWSTFAELQQGHVGDPWEAPWDREISTEEALDWLDALAEPSPGPAAIPQLSDRRRSVPVSADEPRVASRRSGPKEEDADED